MGGRNTYEEGTGVRESVTELYATIEKAHGAAKRAAAVGEAASLGTARAAPTTLVAELWELWGDGRALVGRAQRELLVGTALRRQEALVASAGTSELLARFFARYGSALARCGEDASLTERECAVLRVGADYRAALGEAALVEADEAAFLLAEAARTGEVRLPSVVAADPVDAGPGMAALLRQCGCADAAGGEPFAVGGLPAETELSVLLAAGPAAAPALVLDELRRARGEGAATALVCGPDARSLYDLLAPSLVADGAGCDLRCAVPWGETLVGRAWTAVGRLDSSARPAAAATDFAYNALSGMDGAGARRLNGALRGDRLADGAAAVALLRAASPIFAVFERLQRAFSASGDAAGRTAIAADLQALAQVVREARGLAPVERSRELASAAAAAELAEAAWSLGVPLADAGALLASRQVSVNARAAGRDGVRVEFAELDRLASLLPKSYDAVILADTTDAAFPAAQTRTALDGLARKLGLPTPADALERQRRRFRAGKDAACRHLALVVTQRTAEGEEAYPAFLLKEFAEAVADEARAAARAAGNADEAAAWDECDEDAFGLPVPLLRGARRLGEDDLPASVGAAFAPVAERVSLRTVRRGRLDRLHLVRFLRTADEEGRAVVVLSPSALELYVGCPYAWFLERRVGADAPDEEFGPLEKGSFAHSVLARFYDEAARRGIARLDDACAATWEPLFEATFDGVAAEQAALEPGSGRLVALTEAEGLELARLRSQLRESLHRQARFAPSFAVRAHEHVIAAEDGVDYAGVRVNGRVDRIDVDEAAGRFAVIDYKGSAGAEYAAAMGDDAEAPPLPKRIQGLVYARALRPTLAGLHCAGALYLAYRARTDKDMVAGAADAAVFGEDPFVGRASVVPMNFDAYLDAVEALVAERVRRLYAGDIAPDPRFSGICSYCPAVGCERRLA